jgi:uncharacterized protein
LTLPEERSANATVFVHGAGVTRDEGGFFTRLASVMAEVGIPSLRFDFRGHGESEGRKEDLTISGVANDIHGAVDQVRAETGSRQVNLIGASFGGGVSAFYASRHPELVGRLALFYPLLNYKKRFIGEKPYWHDGYISRDAADELAVHGFISHSPTFKLGRALLNEVFYIQPHLTLGNVTAPTLIIHGTRDTIVPIQSSRDAVNDFAGIVRLVEIEGAEHGIAVHDDPLCQSPQACEWRACAIHAVTEWFMEN